MKKPSIVVVVARDHLFTYMIHLDGNAELVKRVDFQFDSQTRCPLIDWRNEGSAPYRTVGKIIGKILDRYHPEAWVLVCDEDQSSGILENLEPTCAASLLDCVGNDSLRINIANVSEHFACHPA